MIPTSARKLKRKKKKGETNNYMELKGRCSQSIKQGALVVVMLD